MSAADIEQLLDSNFGDFRKFHSLIDSHWPQISRTLNAHDEMLAFAKAHDAYMLGAGYESPDSEALHPKAAANWKACRAAIKAAEE